VTDARLQVVAKDSIQKKKEDRANKRAAAKALKAAEEEEEADHDSEYESHLEI